MTKVSSNNVGDSSHSGAEAEAVTRVNDVAVSETNGYKCNVSLRSCVVML